MAKLRRVRKLRPTAISVLAVQRENVLRARIVVLENGLENVKTNVQLNRTRLQDHEARLVVLEP